MPLSWIRDIRKLTPTNLLANLLILYGLVTCLGFAFSSALMEGDGSPLHNLLEHYGDLVPFDRDWFLFIGTSVSLYRRFRGDQEALMNLMFPFPCHFFGNYDISGSPV